MMAMTPMMVMMTMMMVLAMVPMIAMAVTMAIIAMLARKAMLARHPPPPNSYGRSHSPPSAGGGTCLMYMYVAPVICR